MPILNLDAIEKRLDLSYEMRIEELEAITPHIVGPPGVGKSSIVRQYAEKKARQLDKQFIDYDTLTPNDIKQITEAPDKYYLFADKRLTSLDPIDLSGLPRLVNNDQYVMFQPLALAKLLNQTAGLLFLDEFLNESRPNMLASAFKIVRDYKIGDIALNKQVLVVAASNGSEHSSLSNNIPKPLRDRFDFIQTQAPTIENWTNWMDQQYGTNKWERNILAYLLWKPSDFLTNTQDTLDDNGYEPPATPRGWSFVSLAFAKTEDPQLRESIAKGKLGRVGDTLIAFLANKIPPFDELVTTPQVIQNFNIEQKYLVALTIAEAITHTQTNMSKAKKLLQHIAEKDDRELIAALFAFLQKPQRRELFIEVKNNPTILRALELTGKAL
jgi:GTPase SAR1 family protein